MTPKKIETGLLLVYPPHGLVEVAEVQNPATGKGPAHYRLAALHVVGKPVIYVDADKAAENGLRALSTRDQYKEARQILRQCKRVHGTISVQKNKYSIAIWEKQIHSGDIKNYARLLRDFYRPAGERPMKPREKELFNEALTRLAHEASAIFGWRTPQQIGKVKKHIQYLLTVPREDLTSEEEEIQYLPTPRALSARNKNTKPKYQTYRITAPQVDVATCYRGRFKISSRSVLKIV